MARKLFLALAGLIVGEQMRRAAIPARPNPGAQPQPNARLALDIVNVPGFHAMLRHDPKMFRNVSVTPQVPATWVAVLAICRVPLTGVLGQT